LRREPSRASKVLPCHRNHRVSQAKNFANQEPGKMTGAPAPSPSGISPGELCLNSSSSCSCDIFSNCERSIKVMYLLVRRRDDGHEIAQCLVISEIRWRNQSAASCPNTRCRDRGRARPRGSHRESSARVARSRSRRGRCALVSVRALSFVHPPINRADIGADIDDIGAV